LVRLLGVENVTLFKLVAPENALESILVTLLGIVTLVKLDAPENALESILVRLLGVENVTLLKLDRP